MVAKSNERINSDAKVNRSFKRKNYFFHPDEDFREDHSWGKSKSTTLTNSESSKKRGAIDVVK
ncbi:hypothetical protein [Pedobacter gandavensis]|uniref:hypothetical protein n=1 Tax=Pedobacter gandavensis TaxID=2679963 RepID=UPI0029305CDB|nr:hypothetical protein [Pedobacter gandavensis]